MEDFIKYITGNNATIQAAIVTALASIIAIICTQFTTRTKIKNQKEQFDRTLENQESTTYKELITAERIRHFNNLNEATCKMITDSRLIQINTISFKAINKRYKGFNRLLLHKKNDDADEYQTFLNSLSQDERIDIETVAQFDTFSMEDWKHEIEVEKRNLYTAFNEIKTLIAQLESDTTKIILMLDPTDEQNIHFRNDVNIFRNDLIKAATNKQDNNSVSPLIKNIETLSQKFLNYKWKIIEEDARKLYICKK